MRTPFLLFFLLLSPAFFSFGQSTHRQNLDDFATIDFPTQPDAKTIMGQETFVHIDSSAYYIVIIGDYANKNDFQVKEGGLDKFYDGVVTGALKESGGRLVHQEQFEVNGQKGMEIEYTLDPDPDIPDVRFMRFFFVNDKLVALNFFVNSENRAEMLSKKDHFFNSFGFTVDESDLRQFTNSKKDRSYDIGYAFGRLIGKLLIVGVIVGIVLAVILGIKKIGKKDNHHE